MKQHLTLEEEIKKFGRFVTAKSLGIDVFEERTEHGELIRAYITSKALGGLICQSLEDTWTPCYPEKKNYPLKGRWFSPGRKRLPLKKCIRAVMDPDKYLKGVDEPGRQTAIKRAENLRNPLRAAALIAIMEKY